MFPLVDLSSDISLRCPSTELHWFICTGSLNTFIQCVLDVSYTGKQSLMDMCSDQRPALHSSWSELSSDWTTAEGFKLVRELVLIESS